MTKGRNEEVSVQNSLSFSVLCTHCPGTGFKMKCLLLLAMLTACAAVPQDLSGKMFTFPQQTNRALVRLTTTVRDLSTITVCHRTFADLTREHVLFSMSIPGNPNGFLIFWDEGKKEMEAHIKDRAAEFVGKDYKLNMWHSICTTWDSTSGLTQLWFNGQPSPRKYTSTGSMQGTPSIILGQEQDSHGGGYDLKQAFVGMITDVHMWDHILSPCEIHNYMDDLNYTPGNVLNWRALEYQIVDRVIVEDQVMSCH